MIWDPSSPKDGPKTKPGTSETHRGPRGNVPVAEGGRERRRTPEGGEDEEHATVEVRWIQVEERTVLKKPSWRRGTTAMQGPGT